MAWTCLHVAAVVVVCSVFTSTVLGLSPGESLDQALTHYETLHHSDIKINHRVRRSADGSHAEKDISFEILNKQFHMKMHVMRGMFTKRFRAYTVNSNNEKSFLNIDRTNFLEGHLVDVKGKTRAFAYFEGRDMMATIVTEEDTYVIEPSWRHLPKSTRHSMIAYKKSDLRKQEQADPHGHMGKSFCGYVHADGSDDAAFNSRTAENDIFDDIIYDAPHSKKGRYRRATGTDPNHNTCTLHLVADYHFYQGIGQSNTGTTANYMVGQIQKVNEIYKSTDFQGYTNMGFEISEMTIYDAPTAVSSGVIHHNMAQTTWGTKDLLRAFSKDNDFSGVCLGHLFTNIAFSDGVLGLGWIASSKAGSVGGICSPSSGGYHYNTAWSTLQNKYGQRILTLESQLVTAHEFGHNWGSQHDPATDECAPSSFNGGKYNMYTYSVSGVESNNDNFSPCSTRTMGAVLAAKASTCLTARSTSFCGNKQVETPYEECDAGFNVNDPCCDSNCELKTTAVCSDVNSECCSNCQAKTAGTICRDVSGTTLTCDGNATCDGSTFTCPTNVYRADGSSCADGGTCSSGVCQSFCASRGATPCICDSLAESCQTCCKANATSACTPYPDNAGNIRALDDGKPCLQGRCSSGVCVKLVVQLTDRLWSIIENITVDSLVVYMKNNIVFTVILLSLLLFLPCSLIVACIDWRRDKKDKEECEWHSKDNNTLYLDKDQGQIRHTYTRKRPTADGRRSGANSGASSAKTNKVYPQL